MIFQNIIQDMCERTLYISKVSWTITFYGRYSVPNSTNYRLWISLYGEPSQESVLILIHERNAHYVQFGKLYSVKQGFWIWIKF